MNGIIQIMDRKKSCELTDEQQEYICRKLAAFMPLREIADHLQMDFPESGLADQQVYNKVRHIATTKRTDKWRRKIESYRKKLRKRPLESYATANTFERLRILEQLVYHALECRVRRIHWYPTRKDSDGTVHYDKLEVWEPSYHAAMRGLALISRELQMANERQNQTGPGPEQTRVETDTKKGENFLWPKKDLNTQVAKNVQISG